MANIKLKCSAVEVLHGKFKLTFQRFAAYKHEVEADVEDERDYTAECVQDRIDALYEDFVTELNKLAEDISTMRFENGKH